jgi:hypothetical protein
MNDLFIVKKLIILMFQFYVKLSLKLYNSIYFGKRNIWETSFCMDLRNNTTENFILLLYIIHDFKF